jgi:hypothetical protein
MDMRGRPLRRTGIQGTLLHGPLFEVQGVRVNRRFSLEVSLERAGSLRRHLSRSCFLRLCFFAGPSAFRLNGFLNTLACLFASLCSGSGEIAILRAMKISP